MGTPPQLSVLLFNHKYLLNSSYAPGTRAAGENKTNKDPVSLLGNRRCQVNNNCNHVPMWARLSRKYTRAKGRNVSRVLLWMGRPGQAPPKR